MKVLVCGGRDYWRYSRVREELDKLNLDYRTDLVIEGGCRERDKDDNCEMGADYYANSWAEENEIPVLTHWAPWEKHGGRRKGNPAGPTRNKAMLERWEPDLVLAFPGGSGTANMVKQARAAGVEVREIDG